MPLRRALLALAALAAVFAAPTPQAHADDAIAEVLRDTPLAGYGGWAAWSRADTSGRYRLTLRSPEGRVIEPTLPTSSRPWDVSLGPNARNDVVAIYQRCTSRGCDIRRLDVQTGREDILQSVSSPSYREATPAIWRSTVAFTRRIRGCDVPYVKALDSSAPSRRLLKTKCLQIAAGHLAVRGTRVVTSGLDLSGADENGAGRKTSEVRRYSTRESGSKVLLLSAFGEESNLFGQVALDDNHITTVRYGIRPAHAFVRVRSAGGTAGEVRAHTTLTGAFAKSSSGTSLYLEAQDAESDSCTQLTPVPCRVVRAPRSPFGRAERPLPPKLSVGFSGTPRTTQPLPFRGVLSRQIVQDGNVIRVEPLAGVRVQLHRRFRGNPERFEATPYQSVTGPDGSYEIVVPPPIPSDPWYTAVAATPGVPTWAGRGTVGQTS
jgi:hypothetical protein